LTEETLPKDLQACVASAAGKKVKITKTNYPALSVKKNFSLELRGRCLFISASLACQWPTLYLNLSITARDKQSSWSFLPAGCRRDLFACPESVWSLACPESNRRGPPCRCAENLTLI